MAKILTQKIQDIITRQDIDIEFKLIVNNNDISHYLMTWSIEASKEFGSMQATFSLNNDDEIFSSGGNNAINVGDVVQFSEWFGGDDTEFKKFYGVVNQRSNVKTVGSKTYTIVCLDYISILQFWDIDLESEGAKVLIENEVLTPNYLPSPNDELAHVFNFANNSIADNPLPILSIRNKNNNAEDPQYDGYEVIYDEGQVKLGFPLNARYNYELLAVKYYFYPEGIYAEDILEDIFTESDGYGNYLFNETSAANVITNHFTTTYYAEKGTNTDTLVPNYTYSNITIRTTLAVANSSGATSVTITDATGFPTSGSGNINGDIFSWSGKAGNNLTGIPASGDYSLKAHPIGASVKYVNDYPAGQVWYLSFSNISTTLVDYNFTITGGTFKYLDKRYGRIILESAISTSAVVTCNENYTFKTLQASGIELNRISFRSREVENRFEAIKKLKEYLAPNYIINTRGDNKIWAQYLSQKLTEDYTLKLMTNINYLEDEDLYTRTIFYGKNKNPNNIMLGGNVSFVGTGESYKAIATNVDLAAIREEGSYYVYGCPVSGIGKITTNTIKPIVYLSEIPIDNTSHIITGQQVVLETTTKTETTQEGGGK
jgi:hypothetical protein